MRLPVIRVERIEWKGEHRGYVWYEITHADDHTSHMIQPFERKGHASPDFHEGMAWEWDGNDPMTLSPSYVCEDQGARVHLFLKAGKIELCGDSTVRVD